VIFDLDGTLVDTVEDLAAALNRTLVELNRPPHPTSTVRTMVGGGLGKLLERALAAHDANLDAAQVSRAAARLLEFYAAEPASFSRLYPDARKMLRELRVAGVACGVCTNKPDAISRDLLEALDVADAFAGIVGSTDGLARKPDPAGLRRVLSALDVDPEAAVMVGDSVTDVKAARAAGLAGVILVSYGYSAVPARELGADRVIDNLAELPTVLRLMAPSPPGEAKS
jgi:phosphoglycolate phosphatase